MRPSRLAIFDCDGTLVDSGNNIFAALSDAFTQHGVEVPALQEVRQIIGLSLVEAIAKLTPDEDRSTHVELAESYKLHFQRARAEGRVEEPLFPDIPELLDALEADGWLLAVATGKSDRGLALCLDCHGYAKRFISLQTADRHPSKPHPSMVHQAMADAGASPATTIVIGDTAYDMGMATAAGATGIGAGWGYHQAHEMLGAGALAVADTPLDVLNLIPDLARRLYG
jgi:phosphoglycolate phosphatase